MLATWGHDINTKSDSEKRSLKGKMNAAMHQQTVTYMKPMFKKLKSKVCGSCHCTVVTDVPVHCELVIFMFEEANFAGH